MLDPDTTTVIERLNDALASSGLSMRQFSHALGTSPSRFSTYCSGRTAPSAAFLIRAERTADALSRARQAGIPSSLDAIDSLRRALKEGDEDWAYALTLEIRDRLGDILRRHRELAASWEAQPPDMDPRWSALAAAFVSREFEEAGLPAPKWTAGGRLDVAWVLDTPRLSETQIKDQTPAWLAERNIFIAEKDLVTT